MITGTVDSSRMRRHRLTPSSPGTMTSSSARSGRRARKASSPDRPSGTAVTSKPSRSSARVVASRMTSSSSTNRTCVSAMGGFLGAGLVVAVGEGDLVEARPVPPVGGDVLAGGVRHGVLRLVHLVGDLEGAAADLGVDGGLLVGEDVDV